jgi:hypothetical protein
MKIGSTLVILAALWAVTPTAAAEQGSRSSRAAALLTAALHERKLEVIASRNPDQAGAFIAALYVPGSQLLVVTAPYAVAAVLDKYIADGKHMDVYLALNAADRQAERFFVMDMNADGLRRECAPGESFDSTIRGDSNVSFDGNWRVQAMTGAAYDARFAKDDEHYARLLEVLAGSLTEGSAHTPPSETLRY